MIKRLGMKTYSIRVDYIEQANESFTKSKIKNYHKKHELCSLELLNLQNYLTTSTLR